MEDPVATNRTHWNAVVPAHAGAPSYDVDGFRAGRCALRPIEIEEVGDVAGKTLLHLQCHFGLDSLSWARRGARVTGADFSETAVAAARELSTETGIDAEFVCSEIDSLPQRLTGEFDIVFTSYGVLAWLPDLARWAQVVAHFLRAGGVFHIVELHPMTAMFEYNESLGDLAWTYLYAAGPQPLRFECAHTYASFDAAADSPVTYEWTHSFAEIITSLVDAGLTIETLREFPCSCYQAFPCMTRGDDGWWRLPERYLDFPLLFSLRARK